MTEHNSSLPGSLTITAVREISPHSAIRAVFQTSPEKPVPGKAGKQAGEITLLKQADQSIEVIVSLGEQSKLSLEIIRQGGGSLAKWLRKSGAVSIDIEISQFDVFSIEDSIFALCEGLHLGAFEFNRHKSKAEPSTNLQIYLRLSANHTDIDDILEKVALLSSAVNMARDWSHEPPNVINPITLAARAEEMTRQYHLKCTILDDVTLAEMNAGGILSVGKGSNTPSRMIILEYPGQDAPPGAKPVILVGKAITFDTGGYSLKNPENIQKMKYDKSGGVAVIATLCAAAALKLKTPIIGIIGAAENKISSNSYLPDDIITMLSGATVEIVSTDAEGRMVLADLLTYSQQKYSPRSVIDLATLTGGVVVALGTVRAGLMSNDDDLSVRLVQAGDDTYERLWRLPLDEEFVKNIKGDDSDFKNSGGRDGHAILGGTFLRQFVSDTIPWAHLDIAGVADTRIDLPYCPKGGTGFGVRLLVNYLENLE